MSALEKYRENLYHCISKTRNLLSGTVLESSQKLDNLIVLEMRKQKKGVLSMLEDCKECENKGSELCKTCSETSGGNPSNFKPKK